MNPTVRQTPPAQFMVPIHRSHAPIYRESFVIRDIVNKVSQLYDSGITLKN